MNTQSKVSKSLRKKVLGSDHEYIEGSMTVIPNANYKAKGIYRIKGLGDLFSGSYYVKRVRHMISSGYSVECDVIRLEVDEVDDSTLEDVVDLPEPKAEDGNYSIVIVKKGDTLSEIASKHRTTISELTRLNKLANPNVISVGQKLKVAKG